jgi:O-antigen/teichoic acid export membrane protein
MTQTVSTAALRRLRKKLCPWSVVAPGDQPWSGFRSLFRFAAVALVWSIGVGVDNGADVFLLMWIPGGGGAPAVADYSMWWRFPNLALTLCNALLVSSFPSFATGIGIGGGRAVRLFRTIAVADIGLSLVCFVCIGLWLTPFVHYWLGVEYERPDGLRVASYAGLLVVLRTIGSLFSQYLIATGRASRTAIFSWVQAVTKIGLSLWLVRDGGGVVGVVASCCIASAVSIFGIGWALYRENVLTLRLAAASAISTVGVSIVVLVLNRTFVTAGVTTLVVGGGATLMASGGILALIFRRELKRPGSIDGIA